MFGRNGAIDAMKQSILNEGKGLEKMHPPFSKGEAMVAK